MKNEKTILSEREKILGRVREALKIPAPLPGSHGDSWAPFTRPPNRRPAMPANGCRPSAQASRNNSPCSPKTPPT